MADPNWSSVKLLAPFGSPEGRETFVDFAGQRTFSQISSTAVVASTAAPFATPTTSAMFVNATGLSLPASADWNLGTGDFTIEGWYRSGSSADRTGALFIGTWSASTGGRGWEFFRQANTRQIGFRWSTTGTDEPAALLSSTGAAWGSSWVHLCAMRASGVVYLFVDGVLVGSTAVASIYSNSQPLMLGRRTASTSSTYNIGNLSDWRISNIARYSTAGFTPPTAAFEGDGTNPARLTQGVGLVSIGEESVSDARLSQAPALLLVAEAIPARLTQAVQLVAEPGIRPARITQAPSLVLVRTFEESTRLADVWIITRTDGVKMGFTGHDRPITFRGLVCSPCGSLNPTATAESSSIASLGNSELAGIITSDKITEADLYGGVYDDAYVEVWRVPWDGSGAYPERIAAGWCGNLSHGRTGFSMEVLGPAVKLGQHSVVETTTPGCRWVFADPETCGVDADALAIVSNVTAAPNRARIFAPITDPGTAPQWNNGLLVWQTGVNAGVRCEVKTVDFVTGEISLWAPPPLLPLPGEQFRLRPGCDKSPTTCKAYANYIRFGGFPDLPGVDAISEVPDAKY